MQTIFNLLKYVLFFLISLTIVSPSNGQATQTIRGRILDEISKVPLIGVNVMVIGNTDKVLGSATDVEGNYRIENVPYRIENVPVGRQSIKVTYIGYEEQTVPNIVVTAGKEVILNISLTESVSELNEVVVVANHKEDKTATNNDLAIVSSRSFNVDDTKRYAGSLGDPSRMAANFAGVVGGDDSRNDIVVRGNSPTGMLWQLEGINIPNPNHFGALVSTGGPVSMLNNNNLDKSDFMSSAFPAQYGNATAGVFDLRLRDGNNQKREFMGQIGFNGFELGAEGPFSKKSKSSFIVNYRYSTLAVFQALGVEFLTGSNTPYYQDINFKFTLPAGVSGKFTVFGIGGTSKIDLLGSETDLDSDNDLYGDENTDSYPKYRTGIAGIGYEKNLSSKTFARLTAGISVTSESFSSDSLVRNSENEVVEKHLRAEADFNTRKYSLNFYTRTKFSSRNSITSGISIDALQFDLFNRDLYANINSDTTRLDVADNATLMQAYSTWKHRFNQKFSLNAGLHTQYYSLNNDFVWEPRLSVQYVMDAKHSLSIGYGLHHQTQNITTSFVQTKTQSGRILETNKELGYSGSHHYVLTYDWNITENTRIKAETYYQTLFDVPVERSGSFSVLNTGVSFGPSDEDRLVNKGTGRNYGLELTLERFFDHSYYYLLTMSLFDSKYNGSDGIERNTAFNTQYVVNLLGGKEWKLNSAGKFIALSLKLTTIGGKYLTPIDFERSQQFGRTIYRESAAFSEKQDPYFRADVRISYRKEYKKSTLEISLDMQNVSNNKNIFAQNYNARTNTITTQYQQSFFPVPYVRFTF
jgi:hypothetical protein